jgi:RhtB (resistance to homoserine/threonine) family protein
MDAYWQEFIVFALAHVLSLISPGPDFLMVVQSSLRYSRQSAILVALGIACGEMIHVTYSILGIGLMIAQSIWAFTVLKYLGGAYLVYIGIQSLRSKPQAVGQMAAECADKLQDKNPTAWRAFGMGFLTNALNAKAAFFTVSFFTVLVSPTTPVIVQMGYGLFIWLSTFAWFSLVALFLTHGSIQGRFLGAKHWIERTCGALLVLLGFKLALSDLEQFAEAASQN